MRVDGQCTTCTCRVSALRACAWLVQCMHAQGQCSACMHRVGVVHVCAWTVQCMHVHGWCSACVCSVGAVHACAWKCSACTCRVSTLHVYAWTVQCMHVQCQCSTCMHRVSAVYAWVRPVQHSQSAWCLHTHHGAARACVTSPECTHVHGRCRMGSSVQRCGAQREQGWGGQGLPSPPASSGSAFARSEVQRAVPPRKVQEGGVLLPL